MITTFAGGNRFKIQSELEKCTNAFVALHGEFSLERVDGEEASYEQLQGSAESHPFLSEKKMVVLRNPSANKQFVEKFSGWLERVADTSDVIIVEPNLDKRLSYYKQLKKHTQFVECEAIEGSMLPKWLVELASNNGAKISSSDAQFLVDRVGTNQLMLRNELEKLISYNLEITKQSIELLVDESPQSTVFNLLDAVFGGNTKRTIKIYEELHRQKVEPMSIIGMIAWQLHAMALVKTAAKRSASEIARDSKMNPYVIQKSQLLANKLTMTELRAIISRLAGLDIRLKTTAIDVDEALCQQLISISRLYS